MALITISKNELPRSHVWRTAPANSWIYKEQAKFLCDNEVWCLEQLADSGYVPRVERVDTEVIRTTDLGPHQRVTDPETYLGHIAPVLQALEDKGIRHGDLTEYSVLPRDNRPWLVDFSESRLWDDPRPDKRPEGDEYWLTKMMRKQAVHNQRSPEMWQIISAHVDFEGKEVLDVGCGYGDMLLYARAAGAFIQGIDNDSTVFQVLSERVAGLGVIGVYQYDLHTWLQAYSFYDIALCLSVLPYIDMAKALKQLREAAKQVIIECQYEGDGPGTVPHDGAMRLHLDAAGWKDVRKIGKTFVENRATYRTIWLCQ